MALFRFGPEGSRDSQGEPYITYATYGQHEEGDTWPTYPTEAEAWGVFLQTMGERLSDAEEVEFRIVPALHYTDDGRCYIRTRLSILKAVER